jgi:hypothetical protein
MTAGDIIKDVAVLLNDRDQVQWADADLLPYVKLAFKEFSLRCREHGLESVKEVSAKVAIPTSKTTITISDILDLSYPIKLEERASGSTDLYEPMTELSWEPQLDKSDSLLYWNWREDEIKLVGATTAREVLVYYKKLFTEVSTTSTAITITDASLFLSHKAGALCAALAGGNFERAAALNESAEQHIESYFNAQVKSKQATTIRHRGYRRIHG